MPVKWPICYFCTPVRHQSRLPLSYASFHLAGRSGMRQTIPITSSRHSEKSAAVTSTAVTCQSFMRPLLRTVYVCAGGIPADGRGSWLRMSLTRLQQAWSSRMVAIWQAWTVRDIQYHIHMHMLTIIDSGVFITMATSVLKSVCPSLKLLAYNAPTVLITSWLFLHL